MRQNRSATTQAEHDPVARDCANYICAIYAHCPNQETVLTSFRVVFTV